MISENQCNHGQLKRQCEICEIEHKVMLLQSHVALLRDTILHVRQYYSLDESELSLMDSVLRTTDGVNSDARQ